MAAEGARTAGLVMSPAPEITSADATAASVAREMRGLWIATVANIDWPSARNLAADQQRAEMIDILTKAQAAGLNTIVLHVRPAGDAVYQSALEPWAALLTGTQGNSPGYDPLAFAVRKRTRAG